MARRQQPKRGAPIFSNRNSLVPSRMGGHASWLAISTGRGFREKHACEDEIRNERKAHSIRKMDEAFPMDARNARGRRADHALESHLGVPGWYPPQGRITMDGSRL